jgi:hypothetical protein
VYILSVKLYFTNILIFFYEVCFPINLHAKKVRFPIKTDLKEVRFPFVLRKEMQHIAYVAEFL